MADDLTTLTAGGGLDYRRAPNARLEGSLGPRLGLIGVSGHGGGRSRPATP
jgi:hypothetical protein